MAEVPSSTQVKPKNGNFEKVVNFQADVGRTAAHINKIIACVFGGILIVIGIVLIGDGLYLMHKKSAPSKPNKSFPDGDFDDDTNKDKGKASMVGGAIAIVFGLVIILIACLVHSMTKKSKGFAAVYGTGVELQGLGDIAHAVFR